MQQRFDERNRDLIVNVGGRLVHRDEAGVSPFDSAVQGGDAVWEGLRLYDGRIFRLTAHLDRLVSSAKALAFAEIPSHDAIRREIARTLEANGMRDGVHVRLTLSRGVKITSGMDPRLNQSGPTLIVLAEHKPPVYARSGLSLVTSSIRRFPPDCLDPKIHHANLIQSILAKIEANVAGADDALMLDVRGFVAETNATHVFVVDGGLVRTSRLVACPEGITRAAVLGLCDENGIPAEEVDLSLTEVYRADEVFCTGTMGELAAVTRVDGRTIGTGEVGPVTLRLGELYGRLVREEGEEVEARPVDKQFVYDVPSLSSLESPMGAIIAGSIHRGYHQQARKEQENERQQYRLKVAFARHVTRAIQEYEQARLSLDRYTYDNEPMRPLVALVLAGGYLEDCIVSLDRSIRVFRSIDLLTNDDAAKKATESVKRAEPVVRGVRNGVLHSDEDLLKVHGRNPPPPFGVNLGNHAFRLNRENTEVPYKQLADWLESLHAYVWRLFA